MGKTSKIKLNLGSANKRIDGFINVDARSEDYVDIALDLSEFPYEENHYCSDWLTLRGLMPDDWTEAIDEIFSEECLEHISFYYTVSVLKEWNRILKTGGILTIGVPDIGKMCEYYVNDEICNCVPHKASRMEDFKADSQCPYCEGRGRINPNRWKIAFSGAGKHEYDWHLNHFTDEYLRELLTSMGFGNLEKIPSPYKLKFKCIKKG